MSNSFANAAARDSSIGFGHIGDYRTTTDSVGTFGKERGYWWQANQPTSHVETTQREKDADPEASNPFVYMEFTADEEPVGRIVIELLADTVPNAGMWRSGSLKLPAAWFIFVLSLSFPILRHVSRSYDRISGELPLSLYRRERKL